MLQLCTSLVIMWCFSEIHVRIKEVFSGFSIFFSGETPVKLSCESCLLSDLQFSCQLPQLCMNDSLQGGDTHLWSQYWEAEGEGWQGQCQSGFIESSRPLTQAPFHPSIDLHLLDTNFYSTVIGERDDADLQLLFLQCQVSLKEYLLS